MANYGPRKYVIGPPQVELHFSVRSLKFSRRWRFKVEFPVSEVLAGLIFRVELRWRQDGPLKRWYPTTRLHSATTQKTWSLIIPQLILYFCWRETLHIFFIF